MASVASDRVRSTGIARLPTGAKLFLILSAALLPLALIAIFATLKTSQTAVEELRARLRVAATEMSRNLAIELSGDMTALNAGLVALDADPDDLPTCARLQGIFAQQVVQGARFAIAARDGRILCGSALPGGLITLDERDAMSAMLVPGQGAVLSLGTARGRTRATAFFPTTFLARAARPPGSGLIYDATLWRADTTLPLVTMVPGGAFARRETAHNALGVADLSLDIAVPAAPITSPLIVALLPLLMWAAAAGIAWFVVDRMMIRPLRALRGAVAAYRPGGEIAPATLGNLPAEEIRELGETFRTISRTLATHEAGLAEGLVRQTKLTREVHHRVKNNLQVIASLINFHARGASNDDVATAYASIQRRVDALAVVHRHHFAELEDNRGLGLRAVIGELAANIRATAPDKADGMGITIDLAPYLVTQDVAVAVAFLLTELIELGMTTMAAPQFRIALHPDASAENRATLRIVSPALVDTPALQAALRDRYGRVIDGLSRQLRSKLHYEPLVGAYEISLAVTGRE